MTPSAYAKGPQECCKKFLSNFCRQQGSTSGSCAALCVNPLKRMESLTAYSSGNRTWVYFSYPVLHFIFAFQVLLGSKVTSLCEQRRRDMGETEMTEDEGWTIKIKCKLRRIKADAPLGSRRSLICVKTVSTSDCVVYAYLTLNPRGILDKTGYFVEAFNQKHKSCH